MSKIHSAQASVHLHDNGLECLQAAEARERNTTIVIGVDAAGPGALVIDVDAQAGVTASTQELQDNLRLIIESLNGKNLEDMINE